MAIIKLSADEIAAVSGGVMATTDKGEAILAFARAVREVFGNIFGAILGRKSN